MRIENENLITLRAGLLGLVDQLRAVERPVGFSVLATQCELTHILEMTLALICEGGIAGKVGRGTHGLGGCIFCSPARFAPNRNG